MRYWGKLIGAIVGYWSGLGGWGVMIGLFIGHIYDLSRGAADVNFTDQQTRQLLFFRTTFQVMGHVSKAKGRVTEADIQMATHFMQRLQMTSEACAAAQEAFIQGKEARYPLREKLRELRIICSGRADLIQMFLETQLQMAFVDGELHVEERAVLYVIAEELGISRVQFDNYLRMMEGGSHFNQQGYQQKATLKDACNVLGVNTYDAPTTIKRAYRKLMAEHHPDKLVAKGLPPEMMELAKQKTQEIQAAYDLIKKEKGFK